MTLQITTDTLGLLSQSSLLPGLRHGHALTQGHTYMNVGAFNSPQKSTIYRVPTLAILTLSCWLPAASPAVHGARGFVCWLLWQTDSRRTHSVHGDLCTQGRGSVCIHLGTHSAFREAHSMGTGLAPVPQGSSSHALGFC